MMRRMLILLLCLLMTAFCALAEQGALYTGTVTRDLTLRKTQSTSGKKLGAVQEGEAVQILDLGEKWTKIVKDGQESYILTKYVDSLAAAGTYDDAAEALYTGIATKDLSLRIKKDKASQRLDTVSAGEAVYVTSLEGKWLGVVRRGIHGYVLTEPVAGLTPTKDGVVLPEQYETGPIFEAKYTARADIGLTIRRKPDADSAAVGRVNENERIEVMDASGAWAYVRKKDAVGYVLTSHLENYRRTDPYGEPIPGVTVYPYAARMTAAQVLRDPATGEILTTAPVGAVLAIAAPQQDGRATLPYHRQTAVLEDASGAELIPVVRWDQAQPGDLLAVFTTFFDPVPKSETESGRIFNIEEGVRRVNGTVVGVNETFSFNDLCAPYTKANGYRLGPIINYVSSQKTGYSGGICQVSTTLYNACLQMPFEIVKQQVHSSYGIFYVPVDMDAAVGAGNLDLRLRNVLPYPVRFELEVTGGALSVRIVRAS